MRQEVYAYGHIVGLSASGQNHLEYAILKQCPIASLKMVDEMSWLYIAMAACVASTTIIK